ncbi:GAF domain-containing protein [Solirubrobacter sp. CPCC 204708]|uniref:GAF domain-containing protein n=1 Tax=Solirubrobacter deserti TaxID=2282478 RepID=A0ABT4REK7_9ACTN|nr:GAF domain-containing protein [Solirubrobacter deserti]MBE2318475.1 GAF domain-containing protein [Solirubrobacter deserti]MDA0136933.1 GAF domain-containing protein [Solirubrobacter deserti]
MRSVSALLVDVPASHAAQIARVLPELRTVPVTGEEALSAALARRGWDAVLHGGDAPHAKALALVRLVDPHLPFIVVSPLQRAHGVPSVSSLTQLGPVLTRELEGARMRRRVGGAHRLLAAQQAIADHLAAGLEPVTLCERVLTTLGEALGWAAGAVWRPDEDMLRCVVAWHAADSRTAVAALVDGVRGETYAAGQSLPGRVWAFRRPIWAAGSDAALRAGLVTAAAFPITDGDECVGVIELFATDAREPSGEAAAMFATIGGQLGAYLTRRRRRAFDAAGALIVAVDAAGCVEMANGTACAMLGRSEAELLGRPLPSIAGVSWRWSESRDADGRRLGAVGWGERARLVAASAW